MIVILPNVRRDRQKELFGAALYAIADHDPPLDIINTVLEVGADGTVVVHPLPDNLQAPVEITIAIRTGRLSRRDPLDYHLQSGTVG